MIRAAAPALLVMSALCALGAVGVDAHLRRATRARDRDAILGAASVLPGPDLALAGGARHLRYLSLEEPWAAFSDSPASLDADPAGGAVAPPVDVWTKAAGRHADLEISHGP